MSVSSRGDELVGSVSVGAAIRRVRVGRGWSQQRLIFELQQVAQVLGLTLPRPESLKAMLSRWENGHRVPDAYNRRLLCVALGVSPAALGLPDDADAS